MYNREGMTALLRDVRRVIGSEGRAAARKIAQHKTECPARPHRWFDGVNFQHETR